MRAFTRIGEPVVYSFERSTRPRAAFTFRFADMYFISFVQNRSKYCFPTGGSYANMRYIDPDPMNAVRHPAEGLFVTSQGLLAISPPSVTSARSASTFEPAFTPSSGFSG